MGSRIPKPVALTCQTSSSSTSSSSRSNPRNINCGVCLDFKPSHQFPTITKACTHPPRTCHACLTAHLTIAINGKDGIDPRCPGCNTILSLQDVQRLGTAALVSRYDDHLMKRYLQSLVEYRRCLAPNCNDGQLHYGGNDAPIVTCRSCGSRTCFKHEVPWHAGQTCKQYEESSKSAADNRRNIELSAEVVRKICKSCPGCKFDIQKSEGCDHMTCRHCNFQFCYVCLASYKDIGEKGNSAHQRSCAHYRN